MVFQPIATPKSGLMSHIPRPPAGGLAASASLREMTDDAMMVRCIELSRIAVKKANIRSVRSLPVMEKSWRKRSIAPSVRVT